LRRDTFSAAIDPAELFVKTKRILESEGLRVTSEDVRNGFWDIHARKVAAEMIGTGRVRDVDVIIAGSRGRFEVQVNVGFWGKDIIIPAIEFVFTGGTSSGPFVSAHRLERKLWEEIVKEIDPSLRVCPLDGLTFRSSEDFESHLDSHGARQ
jgi:hypothetical protein